MCKVYFVNFDKSLSNDVKSGKAKSEFGPRIIDTDEFIEDEDMFFLRQCINNQKKRFPELEKVSKSDIKLVA